MPTRRNPDGTETRVSHEESAAAGFAHMEALARAGLTWEELSDAGTVHAKIEVYNGRGGEQIGCSCRRCR